MRVRSGSATMSTPSRASSGSSPPGRRTPPPWGFGAASGGANSPEQSGRLQGPVRILELEVWDPTTWNAAGTGSGGADEDTKSAPRRSATQPWSIPADGSRSCYSTTPPWLISSPVQLLASIPTPALEPLWRRRVLEPARGRSRRRAARAVRQGAPPSSSLVVRILAATGFERDGMTWSAPRRAIPDREWVAASGVEDGGGGLPDLGKTTRVQILGDGQRMGDVGLVEQGRASKCLRDLPECIWQCTGEEMYLEYNI